MAYSAWLYYPDSSAVNLLQWLGMLLLVTFIVLFSFEGLRRLRRIVAALLIPVHVAYLAAYTSAYDMKLRLLPLFDYLYDGRGHASLVLDVAQLAALYLVVSKLRESRQTKTNINPTPLSEGHGTPAG